MPRANPANAAPIPCELPPYGSSKGKVPTPANASFPSSFVWGEFEGRIPLLNHLMDPYGTMSLLYLLPQKVYSFGLQGLVFSTKGDIAARAEKENNKAVISTVQFCLNFKTKLLYITI